MEDLEVPRNVTKAARLFHSDVVCPTETWNIIQNATADLDIAAILDRLEPEARAAVRRIHAKRPESLERLAATRDETTHFSYLLRWCLQETPSD